MVKILVNKQEIFDFEYLAAFQYRFSLLSKNSVARKVPLAPDSIVAMDRGYNDYSLSRPRSFQRTKFNRFQVQVHRHLTAVGIEYNFMDYPG